MSSKKKGNKGNNEDKTKENKEGNSGDKPSGKSNKESPPVEELPTIDTDLTFNIPPQNVFSFVSPTILSDDNVVYLRPFDSSVISSSMATFMPTHTTPQFITESTEKLENKIDRLKKDRLSLINKLRQSEKNSEVHKRARKKLKEKTNELINSANLNYLLSHVNKDARTKLFQSGDFRKLFEQITYCSSFILSIDIRRSTELMLKAAEPELFEKFIVSLCEKLTNVILNNFGIFDKFTGDGILAFFPDFYCGEDAGLMAVTSALQCHSIFETHYRENRNCFISVLKDTGLGIGIDHGSTYKVKMNSALTVIGRPVVYACRMSSAKAGDTLLNQLAYQEIFSKYSKYFNFEETTIDIKNEGLMIAYKVTSNEAEYNYNKPDWDKLIEKYKANKD